MYTVLYNTFIHFETNVYMAYRVWSDPVQYLAHLLGQRSGQGKVVNVLRQSKTLLLLNPLHLSPLLLTVGAVQDCRHTAGEWLS